LSRRAASRRTRGLAARSSHVHVELVDLNRFIAFWLEFYGKLTDEDKALMPLKPTYFLA
jgi:restriction system protein